MKASARCVCVEADGAANHEGDGFGFGLADYMSGRFAPVAAVEQFVRDFMDQD
jgi:hypothetical protein